MQPFTTTTPTTPFTKGNTKSRTWDYLTPAQKGTPPSPFRGLGCFTYKIDGALYFFMGTQTTAAALAHETAYALGATHVEVVR